MRTFTSRVLAGASLVGVALLPSPASAHTAVCVGTGTFTLASGLYYPGVGPSVATNITSLTMTGNCTVTLVGWTITGHCFLANGTLAGSDGAGIHTGRFTWIGPSMVFHGPGIIGKLDVAPAPGESCLPGGPGARTFTFVTNPALLLL